MLEIWRYYARVASLEIADKILRDLDRSAQAIAENPAAHPRRNDLLPGVRAAQTAPYVIFYRLGRGQVEIVRVLHGRRDFPAAFRRRPNPRQSQ